MTIDIPQLDRSTTPEPQTNAVLRNPLLNTASNTDGAAPSPSAVAAAVQEVQTAINAGPNPAFTLDYLSGLSVVTVRSSLTGEVVFQLPDTRALELARLIKDGASLGSLGLLHTKA